MINDFKYAFSLSESNVSQTETKVITGCLSAIYVSADKPSQIIVVYKDSGIPILNINSFVGTKWFFIRAETSNYKGEEFRYESSEILLKDKLAIKVTGSVPSKIDLIIRVEE